MELEVYTDAIMEHLNDLADYSDNIDLTEFREAEAALGDKI